MKKKQKARKLPKNYNPLRYSVTQQKFLNTPLTEKEIEFLENKIKNDKTIHCVGTPKGSKRLLKKFNNFTTAYKYLTGKTFKY